MLEVHRKYCSGANAPGRFLTIYIEEAHAVDGWHLPKSGCPNIRDHVTLADRMQAAQLFVDTLNFPIETVVDSMKNDANLNYRAWPERLYIVMNGTVVYKGGEGPFGYRLSEVMAWFEQRYGPSDK